MPKGIQGVWQADRWLAHEAGKGWSLRRNRQDTIEKDNHTMKQWKMTFVIRFNILLSPGVFVSALTKQRFSVRDSRKQVSEESKYTDSSAVSDDVIMDAVQ